jgi:hypothetical protein
LIQILSSSRRNRVAAAILALVAGMSCGHLIDPPLPPDAQLFLPPPVYARWWAMVESCSGIERPLANVQWYSSENGVRDPDNSDDLVDGYYSLAGNRIVLISNDTLDGGIVRHEMLHALLRVRGHPRSAFLQSCAGTVSCARGCVDDAGPVPPTDPATAKVAPLQLEVTSAVSPVNPGSSVDGGMFTFTITVRNPFPYPVIALLPRPHGAGTPISYPYAIRATDGSGVSAGDLAYDPGVTYFSAGASKHDVIDAFVLPLGFPD